MDSKIDDGSTAGIANRTENIGFRPEEMIACGACGKANPPNRLACLYCAGQLNAPVAAKVQLKLRQLENWEKGYNLIIIPRSTVLPENAITEISSLLSFDADSIGALYERGDPFPAARLETVRHTEVAEAKLAELGVDSLTVSDEELAAERPPVRLRAIEFTDDALILIPFNPGPEIEVLAADLRLIVTGAIFESKTETTKRRKSGKYKSVDEIQTSNDQPVIDFYTNVDRIGYRIRSGGFDFSCLDSEKTILAAENVNRLVSKLAGIAPAAKLVVDYLSRQMELSLVWEPETGKHSHGVQRTGLGQINVSNVASSNNLQQFTKYSRLQRHLL